MRDHIFALGFMALEDYLFQAVDLSVGGQTGKTGVNHPPNTQEEKHDVVHAV